MSLPTPNYCLVSEYRIVQGAAVVDAKILPAGTFVRPIDYYYVPLHVREDKRWAFFDRDKEVFCFTRWGIVPIPRDLIRET